MRKLILLLLIFTILIAGCKKTEEKEEVKLEGTDGLELRFVANSPPETIRVAEEGKIDVTIEARNQGTYSENQGLDGKVFLGGFAKEIITIQNNGKTLGGKFLEKRSPFNPRGGYDLIDFSSNIDTDKLNEGQYNFNLLATACYKYKTKANPSVCIDPEPYNTEIEKTCQVKPLSLGSQGAPIAVTHIEEEVFPGKINFRITIKNVGSGKAIPISSFDDCNPFDYQVNVRPNVDEVTLNSVKIGDDSLKCTPYDKIRLIDKERFVICELELTAEMKKLKPGYTTPLKIELAYTYKTSIQKPIQIIKRTSQS